MGEDKKPEVIIYSTPTCPYCARVKAFLESEGIAYKDYNVVQDAKAKQEMIEKSGQMGVPVLEIKGKIIVGFDQEAIQEALGLGE